MSHQPFFALTQSTNLCTVNVVLLKPVLDENYKTTSAAEVEGPNIKKTLDQIGVQSET